MLRFRVRSAPSRIQGRGVFSLERISARRKIGEVTGELIPLRAARRRAATRCRICLVDVSDTHALDCTRGNTLRHLNHSCDANAFLRICRSRVEVYARRTIRRGEEITVDYGESPHRGGMPCRCGRPGCRSRI
jgi:SET domain-containing protein